MNEVAAGDGDEKTGKQKKSVKEIEESSGKINETSLKELTGEGEKTNQSGAGSKLEKESIKKKEGGNTGESQKTGKIEEDNSPKDSKTANSKKESNKTTDNGMAKQETSKETQKPESNKPK